MGTHPTGPSYVVSEGGNATALKDVIKANEFLLTPEIVRRYDGDLPFLFKVLSIRKALSIQAHPDKNLAGELFEKFPDRYKGSNDIRPICQVDSFELPFANRSKS